MSPKTFTLPADRKSPFQINPQERFMQLPNGNVIRAQALCEMTIDKAPWWAVPFWSLRRRWKLVVVWKEERPRIFWNETREECEQLRDLILNALRS